MVMGDMEMSTDLLVIGAGPAGYSAAFRAADLGLDVVMVDPLPTPGGTSLYKGCIPSKTLLHLGDLISDTRRAEKAGISFGPASINLLTVKSWKKKVIDSLAVELTDHAEKKSVMLVTGMARFENSSCARIDGSEFSRIHFKNAVIATGTRPKEFPNLSTSAGHRIMYSDSALELQDIPNKLLVIGGGCAGLEIGTIYAELGSRVTLIEQENRLLPDIDIDLVKPLEKQLSTLFHKILLHSSVNSLEESETGVKVSWSSGTNHFEHDYDVVVLTIGRKPNLKDLGLDNTQVTVNDRGFIECNECQLTEDNSIYASGDVCGGPLLAHKALREGHIAAENICGMNSTFDVRAIPSVVYTNPQISWCGLSETEAREKNIPFSVQKFTWKYSGRAQTMGMAEGLTKLLIDPDSGRILGGGITGRHAELMIGEIALAVEMGAVTEDLALTLHPHPTLSETLAEAAEMYATDSTGRK